MTDRTTPFARLLLPVLTVGALLTGPLAAGTPVAGDGVERVTFSFAPPEGASYIQREIDVETVHPGDGQRRLTLGSETSVVVSHEAGHIFIVNRVLRAAAARDGQPSDAPMTAALTGAETVSLVRPNGVLLQIDGFRRLQERLLPTLSGEERAALERRLRENRIDDRARASWFETTEILSGQTLELGRDYFFDSAWPTDEGWIPHQTLLRLGPWEQTPHGRLLRLQFAYVADALVAVPGAVRLQPKAATPFAPAIPGKLATGYSVTGNANRLVDPSTLTLWKDQNVRQIRYRAQASGESAVTVSSEEKTDITLEPARQLEAAKPAPN